MFLCVFGEARGEASLWSDVEDEFRVFRLVEMSFRGQGTRRERMCCPGVDAEPKKTNEEVLACTPGRLRGDADSDKAIGHEVDGSGFTDAVLQECADEGVQPAKDVDDPCCDEVVPAREAEVAVEEEEQHEDEGGNEMAEFKPFVAPVSEGRERGEGEVGLGDDGDDACPVCHRGVPLFHHIALPDVEDDEGKGVDQCEDEHGVADPSVEDLESFVADSRHGCDHVGFGGCREDEG